MCDDTRAAAPWKAAYCILSLLVIVLMWFPISRMGSHYSETNFDGFNLHYQEAIARGEKLYGTPPKYTWENYPPVSFHLVAMLGAVTGDLNTAGRFLSLLAYAAIGVWMALILERLGQPKHVAWWAALAWWVWLPAFDVSHVVVNDPHLLGIAIGMAGLYCFVRDPESTRWLCASAALFALSLFTKHSLVDVPAAVGLQLLLTSRKHLGIWLGAAAATSAMLLGLTVVVDGPYILQHMGPPRAYYPWGIADNTTTYLDFALVGFVAAVVWVIGNRKPQSGNVLVWAFVFALPVAMVYSGGAGSNINHFYGAMVTTLMLVAATLPELVEMAARLGFSRAMTGAVLVVPFFVTTYLALPRKIYADVDAFERRGKLQAEYEAVVNTIRQQPGPAICENTPLCSAAGKPREFDPFHADQLVRTQQAPAEQIAELIQNRHFGAIELEWHPNEPMDARPRVRFSGPVMRAIFANYQLKLRTDQYAVFVAR